MKKLSDQKSSQLDDHSVNQPPHTFDVFEPLISSKEDRLSKSCHKPHRSKIQAVTPSMANILDQEKQDLLT